VPEGNFTLKLCNHEIIVIIRSGLLRQIWKYLYVHTYIVNDKSKLNLLIEVYFKSKNILWCI
jgi:hypothetical protein